MKNYATLFLSWMPFSKLSCLHYHLRKEFRTEKLTITKLLSVLHRFQLEFWSKQQPTFQIFFIYFSCLDLPALYFHSWSHVFVLASLMSWKDLTFINITTFNWQKIKMRLWMIDHWERGSLQLLKKHLISTSILASLSGTTY